MPNHTLDARTRGFYELHRRIRCIGDEHAHDALLEELRHPSRPYVVAFVNAHAANLGWHEPAVLASLLRSDLLLRDGKGVELGLRALGCPCGLNMNGTDLIPEILRTYKGHRVALFGTRAPWLDTARRKLEAEGLTVVACRDGFDSPETYLDLAAETKPDLTILAMGMPKQEDVAVQLRARLSHPVLIVNGGAILDFLGGKVPRAPEAMRNKGMEWLYRLYLEPRRLTRRYVLGIPAFFTHVAVTRLVGPHCDRDGLP
ncbi:WecB/TagA/CpsF family glycosyltransferase [Rhodococcus zopfii]|uniref:WecB/TagA/CpsF family glycosyltransferase n=1 Tax=Rhodococcus zopfii TaxID=43772 RepID=UPI00111137FD|nr:WecB/TagA/CpsF family glycosyltransferase [Rhodococcus zopfii]